MLPTLPPHVPPPESRGSVREFLNFSGSRWLIGVVVGIGLLWTYPAGVPQGPLPIGPQAPVQEWQSAIPVLPVLARMTPSGLPRPDPRQRKPPCQPRMGEEEINGYCWLRLDVEPPCVEGQAWERGGKCYTYSFRAVPVPQSGEVRAGNVAGEP